MIRITCTCITIAMLFVAGCCDDPAEPAPYTLEEIHSYIDDHFSEGRLDSAFGDNVLDYAGTFYYGVADYTDLSLWVSMGEDPDEYYQNTHTWNQFVFGWDDFMDPRIFYGPGAGTAELEDDRVSAHRDECHEMWEAYESWAREQ